MTLVSGSQAWAVLDFSATSSAWEFDFKCQSISTEIGTVGWELAGGKEQEQLSAASSAAGDCEHLQAAAAAKSSPQQAGVVWENKSQLPERGSAEVCRHGLALTAGKVMHFCSFYQHRPNKLLE